MKISSSNTDHQSAQEFHLSLSLSLSQSLSHTLYSISMHVHTHTHTLFPLPLPLPARRETKECERGGGVKLVAMVIWTAA